MSLQPRGLINRSTFCYINSILQALLACSPLCQLLKGLNYTSNGIITSTPCIEIMCEFFSQFKEFSGSPETRLSKKNKNKRRNFDAYCGDSLEVSSFYKILNGSRSDTFLIEGQQEDAEEFLGLLLNGLNYEMKSMMNMFEREDEETNKQTPIENIFGGKLLSNIHKKGEESTSNTQPFFTLQLDIERATTIFEALKHLTDVKKIEGFISSKSKQNIEAWQQILIEQLPVVLVLHLKYFQFDWNGDCSKITKKVSYPMNLQIDPKILSEGTNRSSGKEKYKLFAIVYHEGEEVSDGHYLTDAFHDGYNTWLRFDDEKVKAVPEHSVLKPQGHRVPYLLFYRRI
ncbi:ubiquitin carboxyl-terminal hydrolase 10-like [Coccinella septempunctata]|uniref:ubiquitin carboxyl-terminal hydrolase 10-like n=2 Tax=Coccinella septempunctata TaxID=41139 RepID=UPI001D087AAA|nr:ubiquitin carboxyl-terminal hydrolase 10-like [Coccinella septempunctata]XP_044762235.1 ubiquitin carboxyl-terminal hydrolase 10-like [Coccinella septempunctata]